MIGYYVHHQGRGHLHRAACVARHLRTPVTGFSSLPRPEDWTGEWVRLPMDAGPDRPGRGAAEAADPTAGGRLHWVPRHHPGLRDRMGAVAEWIRRTGPSLFVSDVSVEVTLLARLMGVPVVAAAMRGDRFDPAHRLGYDVADALLAPWPADLPEPGWPRAWLDKTVHTGAFSRYDGRPRVRPAARSAVLPAVRPAVRSAPTGGTRQVVVMLGAGGAGIDGDDLRRAQASTPGWSWTFLGGPGRSWTEDPWPLLSGADVVVTHGGQNAVAECAAARVPTVVVPQDRPHGEQRATAEALRAGRLATVRTAWPAPGEWAALLDRTAREQPADRWSRWAPGDGARRAADALDRLAAAPSRGRAA
ncbi:glycosyltransferase [Streptomyces apricus]|uniref:Glycosyl transferase n=1 Tax=Streptomyces apricus TaxID=1828112 RepID=A0A5B0BDQ3_9ACTN|nr:glycosyltransferase [Streptomyces apricus]KAA0940234.1 glycosyl transferase [Streptomyces apricus]